MPAKMFSADVSELQSVTDYVDEELNKYNCPAKIRMQFALCLEEMFVNVAHYAYSDITGSVNVSVDVDANYYSVILEDEGTPFNPIEAEDPDVTLPIEKRKIGGLGIYMVKKTMDEVNYIYDNKNIFCMKKRVQ